MVNLPIVGRIAGQGGMQRGNSKKVAWFANRL
jgi:hypothetical protein